LGASLPAAPHAVDALFLREPIREVWIHNEALESEVTKQNLQAVLVGLNYRFSGSQSQYRENLEAQRIDARGCGQRATA
jgi:hypothetical protein